MKKLYGVTVAMTTPFKESGEVDYEVVAQLTKILVKKGVDCLYPCGTTGEMFRLTPDERKKIAETVVENAEGKVTVFIQCGAMTQMETIELIKHAEMIGADGAGIITPVFFGCNDRELIEYYAEVTNSVSKEFPVYLYNIPQCASNDLSAEVVQKIAERCPNVVGIKYSFADVNRTVDYLNVNQGTFSVLHGCDRVFASMLTMGCDGTVSGIAGVFPEPFVEVYKAHKEGRQKDAQAIQKICTKFCNALKCGENMSYFKEGLKLRGIHAGTMRKPQLDIKAEEIRKLQAELEAVCKEAGISIKA